MRRSAAPRTPKSRRISITSRCCSRTKATPRPQSRYTSARWRSARRRWDSTIPTPRAASTTLLPYCRTKATSRTRGRTTSAPSRSTRRASVLSTPKQIAPAPILRICPSPKAQSVKRFRWRKQLLPRSKRRSAPIIPRRKAPPAWLQRRSPPSAARAMRRPYGSGMGLELGRHSRAVRFRLNSLTLSAISPKQRYPPISGQSAANVTSSCQRRRLEAPRRSASLTSWDYVDALARLRGFAGGKAGFTIFLVRKYLIWNVWATGNIVKKACSEDLPDSQGIVFVIESTSLCSFEEPNGGRTARRTSIGASSRTSVSIAAEWCSGMFCIWARSIHPRRRLGARRSRCSTPMRAAVRRWPCSPTTVAKRSRQTPRWCGFAWPNCACIVRANGAPGYSRDKRPDCPQLVIALVVTVEGLPLAYEVLPGNTADSKTLRMFLIKIEQQYGKARRVWVMDRGVPTEAVLAEMRASDPPVQYLVGTPKGRLNRLERHLIDKPWQKAREGVEVKLLAQDDELYVFAQSADRVAKERAMRRRQLKWLWKRLGKLAAMNVSREEMLMKLGAPRSKVATRDWMSCSC